ncbi:MAG TPA: DUF389 domain-containing protein [Acidobacteriaceae bacterium]|jgi:uncharacterized hydrophobic protein (TIGR00271 family)
MSDPAPYRLHTWLRIAPAARTKIYRQVYADAHLGLFAYWLEILLSAGIATLGLVLNSPAVIIGAMLISPLMGPIMATGLGLAAGDLYLVLKAVAKLLASIAVATMLSAVLVWILPFHSPTAEILGRTNPTLLDLGIALLSGIAGSVAVSRSVGSTDGVTTVPGVAIAVALMPPLCTVGFGIGSGLRSEILRGAGLLFLTNIVAIVFSAFLVFLAIGINSDEVREEMERCRAMEPAAQRLSSGPLASAMRDGGKLQWRVLILLALLAAVAWPLQLALRQLTGEARTRDIVEQEIAALVPKGKLVSEQTEVGASSVAVHVVAAATLPDAVLHKAESEITARSGRTASISVEGIASQSELATLTERLRDRTAAAPPAPTPPPPPQPVSDEGTHLRQRVAPVLSEIWPAETPLVDFALVFAADQATVQVHYHASRTLDPVAVGLLTQELRRRLQSPDLALDPIKVPAPHARGRRR